MVTHMMPGIAWERDATNPLPKYVPSKKSNPYAFITGMLEEPCKFEHRNPLEWAASLVVHAVVLSLLVLAPLYFTDSLDLSAFQGTWLVAPSPPPPPPPAAPAIQRAVFKPFARLLHGSTMMAPSVIPRKIVIFKEAAPPPDEGIGVPGGVVGGVPGGEAGGVLGGIIGGAPNTATRIAPPPPVANRIVRVGGSVKPPNQIYFEKPDYPALAKVAHVQGIVIIDAVIDERGNVVELHALSGPGLLIPSAIRAVETWKYEPTLLNGVPVSVAMHVEVEFHLQ
jgi:periplasmic protein TonB